MYTPGLAIGADWNNLAADMHNAQALNITQKISLAMDRSHATQIKPNTKL